MNNNTNKITIVIKFLFFFSYFNSKPILIIAIAIGIIAIFSKKGNEKIIWGWNKISEILGLIMPNVLLTLVFHLLLTPLALINRKNLVE